MLSIPSPNTDRSLLTRAQLRAAVGVEDGSKDAALIDLGNYVAVLIAQACRVATAAGIPPTLRLETIVETIVLGTCSEWLDLARRPVTNFEGSRRRARRRWRAQQVGLELVGRAGPGETDRHAGHDLPKSSCFLPARELDRQALRAIERIVEARLELVGDEVAIGPGIDHWHRALVEPRQHHVDDAVGLSHLAPTDERDRVIYSSDHRTPA